MNSTELLCPGTWESLPEARVVEADLLSFRCVVNHPCSGRPLAMPPGWLRREKNNLRSSCRLAAETAKLEKRSVHLIQFRAWQGCRFNYIDQDSCRILH